MDATFTDEQQLLADTARQVAQGIGRFDGRPGGDPSAGWNVLAESGFVGMRLPEWVGGAGATALDVAILATALAAAPCRVPFLGPVLVGELLVAAGADRELLAAVADGSRRFGPVLAATLDGLAGEGVVLDGAGAEAGIGLAQDRLVARRIGEQIDGVDLTRVVSRSDDLVDVGGLGGEVAADARSRWEALALTLVSADAVGVMEGVLDEAVAHAGGRVQFGRPIGSFQAVQHLCADAFVQLEASRTLAWYAAWAVDELDTAEALAAARAAKAYVADAVRDVCEASIQVLGGIGVTWESVAHLYLRRGLLDRQLFGDGRTQCLAIAGHRLGRAA